MGHKNIKKIKSKITKKYAFYNKFEGIRNFIKLYIFDLNKKKTEEEE